MFEQLLFTEKEKKVYTSGTFLGEVPVTDLINGDDLAALIGLSRGTPINTMEPWLKWEHEGNIILYSKKPYRHSVETKNLMDINAANDTKTISIKGENYLIGLPFGKNPDSTAIELGNDVPYSHNSEWNLLMYPIVNAPGKSSQIGPDQAAYTNSEVGLGVGVHDVCRESIGPGIGSYIFRGQEGVTYLSYGSGANNTRGWRPRLQLVQ